MTAQYDDIPGLARKETDGGIELVSECTGMRIEVGNFRGRDRFTLHAPAFQGEGELTFKTSKWPEIRAAYGERWLRWVTVTIGLGFHPDTSADQYSPDLPEPLRSEYDEMIDFIFECVPGDPYAIGMDAWEKGGFLDDQSTAPAP